MAFPDSNYRRGFLSLPGESPNRPGRKTRTIQNPPTNFTYTHINIKTIARGCSEDHQQQMWLAFLSKTLRATPESSWRSSTQLCVQLLRALRTAFSLNMLFLFTSTARRRAARTTASYKCGWRFFAQLCAQLRTALRAAPQCSARGFSRL